MANRSTVPLFTMLLLVVAAVAMTCVMAVHVDDATRSSSSSLLRGRQQKKRNLLSFHWYDPFTDYIGDPSQSETGIFGRCQGRCQNDAQCQDGLVCWTHDDNNIPGCQTMIAPDFVPGSYCIRQEDFDAANLDIINEANPGIDDYSAPLGRCQGDCDVHRHCEQGLVCWRRDAGDDDVPGCNTAGLLSASDSSDFCVLAIHYLHAESPMVYYERNVQDDDGLPPLKRCEGDCDHDDHCEGDLVCYQRNHGNDDVPGCNKRHLNAGDTNDYCVRMEDI